MAFSFTNSKGKKYFLHSTTIKRPSGKDTVLYYFSGEIKQGKTLDAVPAGKKVVELASGLPALKNV